MAGVDGVLHSILLGLSVCRKRSNKQKVLQCVNICFSLGLHAFIFIESKNVLNSFTFYNISLGTNIGLSMIKGMLLCMKI